MVVPSRRSQGGLTTSTVTASVLQHNAVYADVTRRHALCGGIAHASPRQQVDLLPSPFACPVPIATNRESVVWWCEQEPTRPKDREQS